MGRIIAWSEIPDQDVVPVGVYQVKVESFEEATNRHGHLMYKARYRVADPEKYSGIPLFDYFSVGTEEYPNDVVGTTVGAKLLKAFVKAVGVPFEPDDERLAASFQDQELLVSVSVGEGNNGARNNVERYYKLGSRPVTAETPTLEAAPKGVPRIPAGMRRAAAGSKKRSS